ncbi:MAG: hypothetical protein PVF74_03920 [Anaerolineales bacterium]
MRKFKCFDCGHTWQIIFGGGEPGFKQACPKCKSLNIHRINKMRGGGRSGKRPPLGSDEDFVPGRGRWRRGREVSLQQGKSQTEDTSDNEA